MWSRRNRTQECPPVALVTPCHIAFPVEWGAVDSSYRKGNAPFLSVVISFLQCRVVSCAQFLVDHEVPIASSCDSIHRMIEVMTLTKNHTPWGVFFFTIYFCLRSLLHRYSSGFSPFGSWKFFKHLETFVWSYEVRCNSWHIGSKNSILWLGTWHQIINAWCSIQRITLVSDWWHRRQDQLMFCCSGSTSHDTDNSSFSDWCLVSLPENVLTLFNPFTLKSDQLLISPAALPEIWHHTIWRTWLRIFWPFYSPEWSITNFPCSLTRNITSHNMNLAFYSLLRWKIIVLPFLTTLLVHSSLKSWENVLFELRSEHVTSNYDNTSHLM